jgi:hypothetical protein
VFACAMVAAAGFVQGFIISGYFPATWLSGWIRAAILIAILCGVLALHNWGNRKFKEIEKKYDNMARGAAGEILVGQMLGKFPDNFCIINDLSTPNGNIDHVVVGPTGVYILDTKAWRGVVEADGKGELLLNGQQTDKNCVRQFVGRMMGIKEKVLTLAPGMDAHFNAVFVFTAARVNARWGTTSRVNCITDDQLFNYIVESDYGKKLKPEEVSRIAQAFLGLAHMDKEFGRPALRPQSAVTA